MRIIAGQYGGRRLEVPKTRDIRPTSDKIRGAIFNALQSRMDLAGANVLDAFCGTGALGLEALSRGAQHCVFIDKSKGSLKLAERNAAAFGARGCCVFLNQAAEKIGRRNPDFTAADLFFCDPPYNQNLLRPALDNLAAGGWIAAGALGVLECEKNFDFVAPEHFESLSEKVYGDTKILFVKHG